MLKKEEIISAYYFVLGRAPESEQVISDWLGKDINLAQMRDRLLGSIEFKSTYLTKAYSSRVIVFIHIPKTAGTALRVDWLLKNIKGGWCWSDEPAHYDFWEKMKTNPLLVSSNSMIGGHKHIADFIDLNIMQPKTYLSVVRKPIDRAISYFNFIKVTKSHPYHQLLQNKSLLESIQGEDQFGKIICSNEQLKFLFNSKKTIDIEDNIIIGKQEFVSEFIDMTNEEFSFEKNNVEGGLPRVNAGKSSYKKDLMNENGFDEAVELLAKKLAREIEFYDSFDRVIKLDSQQYDAIRLKIVNPE